MAVDRDEVRRMAALARLRLEPEALDRLAREVGSILEHMEVLAQAGAPGTATPEAADSPADGDGGADGGEPSPDSEASPDSLTRPPGDAAPAWSEGFFLVPRLPAMEGEEEPPEDGGTDG